MDGPQALGCDKDIVILTPNANLDAPQARFDIDAREWMCLNKNAANFTVNREPGRPAINRFAVDFLVILIRCFFQEH